MDDAPLRVGDVLGDEEEHAFIGPFGRDAYGPMRVEAIGSDWVVARHIGGPDEGLARGAMGIDPDALTKSRQQLGA